MIIIIKSTRNLVFVILTMILVSAQTDASGAGYFRTVDVETPPKGALRISNTSFYSPIQANNILKSTFGIYDSRIFSSLTNVELGLTDHISLNGTLPFYADFFSQGNKKGEKTGPGNVAVGVRMSFSPGNTFLDGFSVGAGLCIPEEFGYGSEPLGFRTFSTGELSYRAGVSCRLNLKLMEMYLSSSFHWIPNAKKTDSVNEDDVFYDSGYGYLGIGASDPSGLSRVIFQNNATVSLGTAIPVKPWLSAIVEASVSTFIEKPKRDMIFRAAPGIRLGRPDRIHLNVGMDYRISGPIPDKTYLIRVNIPFIRPLAFGVPVREKLVPAGRFRAQNSLVAVANFSKSDITYLYENELKDVFSKQLGAMEIVEEIPSEKVDVAFMRMELVPRKDSPGRLGVRMGANYLINTDVSEYSVERKSSSTIPFLIGFPKTTFSLSAQASVTDLVSGRTHDLGLITAQINRSRGINLFPSGASSDIFYLSEPERQVMERELINRWVRNFNAVIFHKLEVFGWDPKHEKTRGDEDVKG